jgi:hypothetical protein
MGEDRRGRAETIPALERLNRALISAHSQQGGRRTGRSVYSKRDLHGLSSTSSEEDEKEWAIGKKEEYKPRKEHLAEFQKLCPGYDFIPASLPAVKRIIAIGDIHGDLKLAIRVLKLAKVIDRDHNWIAQPPNTVIVQVGDQVDRCRPYSGKCENPEETVDDEDSDLKILNFFNEIHRKATKVGGAVYSLLGNHEIMNVQGDMRYVSHLGLKGFAKNWDDSKLKESIKRAKQDRIEAFKPGSEIAKMMACSRTSVLVVGSNIFVHAAVLEALLKEYGISKLAGFDEVNAVIRRWLLKVLDDGENVDRLLVDDKLSPFWPRILGQIPHGASIGHPDCIEYLKPVLETLHLEKMIIGHTPQLYESKQGVNAVCGNHLIRADIGSSMAFAKFETGMDRRIQAVEILDDIHFTPIDSSYDNDHDGGHDGGAPALMRLARGVAGSSSLFRHYRKKKMLRHTDSENGAALARLDAGLARG